jgi:dihydrofolate synthase/folylpolyglutamate synthase
VVGSNGKGSVVHYLSNLFSKTGKSVLALTSPHLNHPAERIQIDSKPIPPAEFVRLLEELDQEIFERLTAFEILFYLALKTAEEIEPDFIILEAGMGGRWDATSSLPADFTVLTGLELEHTRFLGETKKEILVEKTVQIPAQTELVAPEFTGHLADMLEDIAAEKDLSLTTVDNFGSPVKLHKELVRTLFNRLSSSEAGGDIKQQLETISPPAGRREKFNYKGRKILLDVAHTPAAINKLLEESCGSERELFFIFGCLKGKKYKQMLDLIAQQIEVASIILTEVPSPRAVEVERLAKLAGGSVKSKNCEQAAAEALKNSKPGDKIVVAGSFPLVGWFRERWLK